MIIAVRNIEPGDEYRAPRTGNLVYTVENIKTVRNGSTTLVTVRYVTGGTGLRIWATDGWAPLNHPAAKEA